MGIRAQILCRAGFPIALCDVIVSLLVVSNTINIYVAKGASYGEQGTEVSG